MRVTPLPRVPLVLSNIPQCGMAHRVGDGAAVTARTTIVILQRLVAAAHRSWHGLVRVQSNSKQAGHGVIHRAAVDDGLEDISSSMARSLSNLNQVVAVAVAGAVFRGLAEKTQGVVERGRFGSGRTPLLVPAAGDRRGLGGIELVRDTTRIMHRTAPCVSANALIPRGGTRRTVGPSAVSTMWGGTDWDGVGGGKGVQLTVLRRAGVLFSPAEDP